MPTTLIDMVGDLRTRLNDPTDTQITLATKKLYINNGIRACWPSLYKVVVDQSNSFDGTTQEYLTYFGSGVQPVRIFRVEYAADSVNPTYVRVDDYEVFPNTDGLPLVRIPIRSLRQGANLRFWAAAPIPTLVNDADAYAGPPGTEELPVLYAMGESLSHRVDDRVDHRRYNSTQAANGVSSGEVMDAAQFFFAQFEVLLDRFAMPLPASL